MSTFYQHFFGIALVLFARSVQATLSPIELPLACHNPAAHGSIVKAASDGKALLFDLPTSKDSAFIEFEDFPPRDGVYITAMTQHFSYSKKFNIWKGITQVSYYNINNLPSYYFFENSSEQSSIQFIQCHPEKIIITTVLGSTQKSIISIQNNPSQRKVLDVKLMY